MNGIDETMACHDVQTPLIVEANEFDVWAKYTTRWHAIETCK